MIEDPSKKPNHKGAYQYDRNFRKDGQELVWRREMGQYWWTEWIIIKINKSNAPDLSREEQFKQQLTEAINSL